MRGLLEPSDPIRTAGLLEAGRLYETFYELSPGPPIDAMEPAFRASHAQFVIHEERRPLVHGSPLTAAEGVHVITERGYDLQQARAAVVGHGPDGVWFGHPGRSTPLRVVPQTECAISPVREDAGTTPLRDIVRAVRPYQEVPTLAARCDVRSLQVDAPPMIMVLGTVVRFQGFDVEDGLERTVEVATGLFRTASPTSPVTDDLVLRYLYILPQEGGRLAFDTGGAGNQTLRLRSTVFTTFGGLTLPAAPGFIAWGPANHTPAPELSVEGTFVLRSPVVGQIDVDGVALQAPTSTRSMADAPLTAAASTVLASLGVGLLTGALRPLWSLFTRITRSRALDHENRRAVHAIIQADPGIGLHEIADRLGIPRSTVVYHVRVLRQQGLIVSHRFSRRQALFPTEITSGHAAERVFRLRDPRYRRLIELLEKEPRLHQVELARRLGLSQPQVSRLLRALVDLHLVPARNGTHGPGLGRT